MAFVESLAPFFSEFGVDATLDGVAVRVIYDSPYLRADAMTTDMSADVPKATIASTSVPALVYGKALVIPGIGNFTVAEAQPDGTGITALLLERA